MIAPTPASETPTPEPPIEVSEPEQAPPDAIEVTVVGTPLSRTPGSAHVVRSRQLETFNYDDPQAALASVPGVYARGEDGVGLRPNIGIRGVDPERSSKLTLMEDGVLFGPAPYSAPAAYYFPLITRMTQIRVTKGPGATSYGPQTIGGAIDLITRPIPSSLAGGADFTLGSYLHRKAHVHLGTSDGRIGFLIEGVHLANDGFKELPNGGDTGFYRNEWMFKGAYSIDDSGETRHELRLKLTYSEELSNETYLGISDADFRANPLQRYQASALDQMRNHRTALVATHVYEPTEHFSLTTNVYRHDYARTWRKVNKFGGTELFPVLTQRDGGSNDDYLFVLAGEQNSIGADQQLWIGPNARDFVSQGVESRLRWDTATGPLTHSVTGGVRFHHDRIDRLHSESPFALVEGDVFPVAVAGMAGSSPVRVTTANTGTAHALAVNAADAVSWQDLTVTPGVRVEVMRLALEDKLEQAKHARWLSVLIPGVGAYYALTDDLGVLGGVYRGFSAPVPAIPGDGEKDAEPELAINYELGVRYAASTTRAEVIGFYNDYSNMNVTCTASAGCANELLDTQVQAGRARIFGVELLAEHEFKVASFKLPLSASYTVMQTELFTRLMSANPTLSDVSSGDHLPYVPLHQLSASAGLEHKRAGGNVSMNYVSSMREQAGRGAISDGLHTDAQFTVDITGRYQVLDDVQLYVNVRNLFDSMYVVSHRPFGARPNAPRWIQIGAKVDL